MIITHLYYPFTIYRVKKIISSICFVLSSTLVFSADTTLIHVKTIRGGLSPKSIVYSGNGLFFAQNMMYQHTISVYDEKYNLVKKISDHISPADFGFDHYKGKLKGSPVECAFSCDGKFAYVSNYHMEGEDFTNPGCDSCSGTSYDKSFIYKINTSSFKIENIIEAGSVPKYLAVSPDNNFLFVSNWSSADVSMIDLKTDKEVIKLNCGRFPRGIAIDRQSNYAYVAIMGGSHIMRIDIKNKLVEKLVTVGRGPRHLCIDPIDDFLYASLNHEGNIAKINLKTLETEKLFVGGTPRSMTISTDGKFIYVVNYSSNKITKINTRDFKIKETISTGQSPIGITYNKKKGEIWVACYSGSLMVFKDTEATIGPTEIDIASLGPAFLDFYSSAIKIIPINGTIEEKVKPTELAVVKPEIISSLKTENVNSEKEKSISNSGNFFIVVGSFKQVENANRQVEKLKKEGYTSTMITNSNGFHYAAIGGYENKEVATIELKNSVTSRYPQAWIFLKK